MPLPAEILKIMFPDSFDGVAEGTREVARDILSGPGGVEELIENMVVVAEDYVALSLNVAVMEQALREVRDAGSWEGAKTNVAAKARGAQQDATVLSFPTGGKTPDAPGFYL